MSSGIELYQVQGIAWSRKRFFGLSWVSAESFYDSKLSGEAESELRKEELQTLSREEMDALNVVKFEALRVERILDGSLIAYNTRIHFDEAGMYPHKF